MAGQQLSFMIRTRRILLVPAALCFFFLAALAFGQIRATTGTVKVRVTDPRGAVVRHASVTFINKKKRGELVIHKNANGLYSSGPLVPGAYLVRVSAPWSSSFQFPVTVQSGVTCEGKVKLRVGSPGITIHVASWSCVEKRQ